MGAGTGVAQRRQAVSGTSIQRWFWLGVSVLIAAHVLLQVRLAREDSQTNDEGAHLVSGYSYWKLHDWRLNPEHPPLSKLAASAPLLWLPLDFHPEDRAWRAADEFKLGHDFLYRNRTPADDILFRGRIVTIVFSAILVAAVAFWVRARFGPLAAFLSASLAAFDPTLLAHGHYVTSDVPVALFYSGAIATWYAWLESGGSRRLLLTALLTGLALATKFSALLLFPTFLLLWVFKRRRISWDALYFVFLPFAIVWAVYGFDVRPLAGDPRIGAAFAANPLAHVPVPAYYFFRGIHLLFRHAHGGHTAYLLGQLSSHGFFWYFPVAFLVKTPVGLLVLIAGAVAVLFRYARTQLLIALPVLLYVAASVVLRINIGVRHLLPVYPFFYALVGAGVWGILYSRHRKPAQVAAVVCVLAVAVESMAVYPYCLGFFNVASGGPRNGAHYLLDSNLDWGQDLKRLPAFLRAHRIGRACLAYFGEAEPSYYGITAAPLKPVRETSDLQAQNCTAIVSAQLLLGVPQHPFPALERRRPDAIVGTSLFVFEPSR